LQGLARECSPVLALVICSPKSFQVLARPLLYRQVVFDNLAQFSQFASHVVSQPLSNSLDVGQWVISLIIDIPSREPRSPDLSLSTVLFHLPNLRTFVCTGMTCAQDEIVALASNARTTLRTLDVVIAGQTSQSVSYGLVLTTIGHLHALTTLELEVSASWMVTGGRHPLSDAPGLHLRRLTFLRWSSGPERPAEAFVSFLARSRFPALEKVVLCMKAAPEHAEALGEFIESHPTVTILSTAYIPLGPREVLLGKARSLVRFVSLLGVPHESIIDHLPPSCRTLSFPWGTSAPQKLLATIARLRALPADEQTLQEIQLISGFSWTAGQQPSVPESVALESGRMLHYASLLRETGIRIKDANGAVVSFS
jgi:hypothetical protein